MHAQNERVTDQSEVKAPSRKIFSHPAIIVGICLTLFISAFTAIFLFNISLGTLIFAAIALACPLFHFLMMKNENHKHK